MAPVLETLYTDDIGRCGLALVTRVLLAIGQQETDQCRGRGECLIQAARTRPGMARVRPPKALPIRSPHWSGAHAPRGFDFLAYLLAMALKESRRLSGK